MKARDPFVSDHVKKIYFWESMFDGPGGTYVPVTYSSHPHPLLPHYCKTHRWYTSIRCPSHRPGQAAERRRQVAMHRLAARPYKITKKKRKLSKARRSAKTRA
jgi:hypothetical protein